MNTRKLVTCAVMTALLIVTQFALSFVSGVELVTVILLCFCYTVGIRYGVITATAFSLLRCMLFGFTPNVVILYLVYYNLFALLFGGMKSHKPPIWVCPVLLCLLSVWSAYFAITGVPISILYQDKLCILLWVLFGISIALIITYFILIAVKKSKELAEITVIAATCAILFTLLDDIISPIILGYGNETAIIYFYTSFLAMIPQTICVTISVLLLFYPLKKCFQRLNLDS